MSGVALDEGIGIDTTEVVVTIEGCEKLCDKTDGCKSFAFCAGDKPNNACYLKKKEIFKNSAHNDRTDCFKAYKTCKLREFEFDKFYIQIKISIIF